MVDFLQWASPLMTEAFVLWGSPVTWLEILAVALSLAMVFCNIRIHPMAWPLAIASSALYALLFANSKLYGEAGLQLLFIAVSVWGWRQWLASPGSDGDHRHRLDVGRMGRHAVALTVVLGLAAWPLLGGLLDRTTDSDVPYFDALATVGSVIGQLLLGRKRLENWVVWLMVNLFSVGLFAFKGLWLTTLLYLLFAWLSVQGWRAWRLHLDAATVVASRPQAS